jgi:hypothetical protein
MPDAIRSVIFVVRHNTTGAFRVKRDAFDMP